MNLKKTIFFIEILIIIPLSGSLLGQSKTWDVVMISNHPYRAVILQELSYDTLYVKAYGSVFAIPVDSINYLKREKPSLSGAGVIFGMTAGGIIGYERSIRRSEYYHGFNVMIGMLSGGLVGFILGEAVGSDEYRYVQGKSHEEKIKELRKILEH